MASAWGDSWADYWGDSWGTVDEAAAEDEYTKPTEPMCKEMCELSVKRMDSDWQPD